MVMVVTLTSLNGPGLSTDAVNYLSTADNVARGIGFRNFEGDHYVLWPPLYPAILAGFELLFGVDPQVSASVLNALAFGGIVLLMGILARRILERDVILCSWAVGGALLSTSTFAISVNVASDPIFIVLALSFLILFDGYARDGDRASLVGLVAVCGLACLQRYIGATLILTGAVGIVYARWSRPRRGLGEAAIFAGLSVAPLGVWIVRNYLVSGTFLGVRDPETWKPMENLLDIGFKAARWFVPYQLSSQPAFWVVLVIGLAIVVYVRRKTRVQLLSGVKPEPITFVLILFPIIYLAFMVVLTKSVDHKNIIYDDRLYLPAYFPLFVLSLLVLRRMLRLVLPEVSSRTRRYVLLGAAAVWLLFPAYGMYKFWVRSIHDKGIAYYNIYNTPTYQDSAVTSNLKTWASDSDLAVYSNYPAAVYLETRRVVGSLPGRADFFGVPQPLEGYAGRWPGRSPAVLVWYEPNTKRNLYGLSELSTLAQLQPLFTSDDGAIYALTPR
jgi:hypothetical protein